MIECLDFQVFLWSIAGIGWPYRCSSIENFFFLGYQFERWSFQQSFTFPFLVLCFFILVAERHYFISTCFQVYVWRLVHASHCSKIEVSILLGWAMLPSWTTSKGWIVTLTCYLCRILSHLTLPVSVSSTEKRSILHNQVLETDVVCRFQNFPCSLWIFLA